MGTTQNLDNNYIGTELALLSDVPELPSVPSIKFESKDGLVCMTSSDANKLLNYFQNELPRYQVEMDNYKADLDVVFGNLKATNLAERTKELATK